MMEKSMTYILSEALDDIEILQSYYDLQQKYTVSYVVNNVKQYKYGLLLDKFFLKQTLNLSDEVVISQKEQEILDKILIDFSVKDGEEGKVVEYKLNREEEYAGYEMKPNAARKGFMKLIQLPDILDESTIMMLLVKYEAAIAEIYRFLIEKYPDAYLSNKGITYSELISSDADIHLIKEKLISKEVDEFMRKPISDWYEVFGSKHKTNFLFGDAKFDTFSEVYYRRNLIVHNQGIVNEIYKNNVPNSDLKIGDRIAVDSEYIDSALMDTRRILIGTFWGLRKAGGDVDSLYDFLFRYGYDCLKKNEWDLAEYIYSILLQEDTQPSDSSLRVQVNMWIAIKNGRGLMEVEEEIKNLDVSAMNEQFIVAKYALLNQYDDVSRLLEKAIDKEMPSWTIEEWPLFIQYRETEQYKEFVDSHKDIFETKGYESDNQSIEKTEDIFLELSETLESDLEIS